MSANSLSLVLSCLAMVILTFLVGLTMLFTRVGEMRRKRLHPQAAAATSIAMGARFENVQPADNFRNLFEVPVLFYALVALALAIGFTPAWLSTGAWVFVALRVAHSVIHCTYNTVYHRLVVFLASFALLLGLWVAFAWSMVNASAA